MVAQFPMNTNFSPVIAIHSGMCIHSTVKKRLFRRIFEWIKFWNSNMIMKLIFHIKYSVVFCFFLFHSYHLHHIWNLLNPVSSLLLLPHIQKKRFSFFMFWINDCCGGKNSIAWKTETKVFKQAEENFYAETNVMLCRALIVHFE